MKNDINTVNELMSLHPNIESMVEEIRVNDCIDMDIDIPELLRRCYKELITILADDGISVYGDFTDFYELYNLVTIYKSFTPDSLADRSRYDEKFRNYMESIVDEDSIFLELLQYDTIDDSLFVCLSDKVTSTKLFNERYRDARLERPVVSDMGDPLEQLEIITLLRETRDRISTVIDELKGSTKYHDLFDEMVCDKLLDNFRNDLTNLPYLSLLIKTSKENKDIILEKHRVCNNNYLEYYKARNQLDLSIYQLVNILITKYSDKYLLDIDIDVTELSTLHGDVDDLNTLFHNTLGGF